ncbi:MAG: Sensory/regulatory protein RpfC [Pseudomonadota bacterium]|jgi:signal transduction histidine kinase/CheY-like chemotaxis protein
MSPLECVFFQGASAMTNPNYLFYLWVLRKLPSSLRSSQNFYFLLNSLGAVLFLIPIGPLMLWLENPYAGWSCSISAVVLSVNILMWRKGLSLVWVHAVYQTTLMFLIYYNAAMTFGVSSTMLVFMGVVPLLPVFTVGRTWAIFWVLLSFILLALLLTAQLQGYLPMRPGENWNNLLQSAVCIVVLEFTQIILVFVYDSANSQNLAVLRRNNLRLGKLSSALLVADSHKDKFLAMVSHDMRTPLNAVIGYLGLLHDNKNMTEESKDFVNSAQHAAAHLLTVINDLLDFSQIRLGQLTLHPQVINLPLVLRQTFHTLSNQAQEAQLDYRIEISPQVPTWVLLDQNRLSQILINLLGNAIKFTPKGHVLMQVSVSSTPGGLELVCRIEDTGIGMTASQQERIYQPFTQVHDVSTSLRLSEPMRGNGLGLAITHSLVKSHQGRLHLTSEPGQGSVFTLYLPLVISAEPANPLPSFNLATSQDPAPIHVLVVDDNDVNRLVVSTTLLRSFPNAIIEQAENGTEALNKMRKTRYELVLIDLVMPDIDGADVVHDIRTNSPEPFCSVPAIALTANVAQDAVDRCKAAGVDEVLPKPFDRNTLIRAVRAYTVDKDRSPPTA